jgi:tetratricopeptide (TPR) repeat protein
MAQNPLTRITDDEYACRRSAGPGLKIKPGEKKRENYQSSEKSEGAMQKLFSLFRKEKWEVQTELQNYISLVKKEPRNANAHLRLSEIYRKKGETEKAIVEYLRTAEIHCRTGHYLQALALCKRILKENPNLDKVELKIAEIYVKMGLLENAYSQYERLLRIYNKRNREDKAVEVMCRMAELSMHRIARKEKTPAPTPTEKNQLLEPEVANPKAADAFQGVSPAGEEKKGAFNLSAELEADEPMADKIFKGIIAEKGSCGFEEILQELKKTSALSTTYPDFNYHMGVACREMGFIEEAIEQFQIALEKEQKSFEAALLLGLCYCEKRCWNEARQSFEEALKVMGISQEMILKVKYQLALVDAEEKREEANGFSSFSPVGSQELRLLYRSESQKKEKETPLDLVEL